MKPQLRGRIRRNVATLLELGADVTVLTVASNKDFFVGLEHPRLRAEYLAARSLYVRFAEHTSRRALKHAESRRARAAGESQPSRSLPRWIESGMYALAGILLILTRLPAYVRRATTRALHGSADLGRRFVALLPVGVRTAGWRVARWQVRARRRLHRWWVRRVSPRLFGFTAGGRRRLRGGLGDRRYGPILSIRGSAALSGRARNADIRRSLRRRRRLMSRALLRRRRTVRRAAINRRLDVRRSFVRRGKDLLRPWHRTSRFFAFWRDSAERAAQLSPDMVVSSDLPGLVGAGRAARRLGIPHLHDCHELYLESTSFRPIERRMLAPMERRYMRRADAVVAVNASIADEYERRYGCRPVVVRNCAPQLTQELQSYDLRTLAGLSADSRVVLYQGGFSPGRGLDVCVAAVEGLPDDVHLVLLGFGPLRDPLLEWAHDAGVSWRVHVLDAVPPEELAQWTVSADVGLMPYQPVSRNNLLALPNKVFEYTAVGLPIVVSDLPELRSIALDAGCGAVYDPFDAASLTRALSQVLDRTQYQHYRDAARVYGRINVWENERNILVGEMLRIAPRLGLSESCTTTSDVKVVVSSR